MGERTNPRSGFRYHVGGFALAVALTLAPSVSSAQDRSSGTQISGSAGPFSYMIAIPEIDHSGSNLTVDRLHAVIGSGAIKELAGLKAKRISIPKIVVTVNAPQEFTGQSRPTVISVADIILNDIHDGSADGVTIGAIEFQGPSGAWKVRDVTARHIDVSGLLAPPDRSVAINSTVRNPSFAFEGASFAISDPGQPDRWSIVSLLSLEAIVEGFRHGIPTHVDIEGIGLAFDLPTGSNNPLLFMLRAAGVARFNGTFRFAVTWDENYDTITIAEASLADRELGGLFLVAEIHEAGKSLFSKNLGDVQSALSGLAVSFITLGISDSGLGDRLAGSMAKPSDADAGSARGALIAAADEAMRRFVLSSNDVAAVTTAVRQFAAGAAGYLEITAQAKTQPGIALTDLANLQNDLPTLLPRVTIDAQAK